MRRLALFVLAAGLLGLDQGRPVAADAPKEDAAKKEYARFEGTWKFVSLVIAEKEVPAEHLKGSLLILKGNQFTVKEGKVTYKGTFKVDLSKTPKQIDITFTEGPMKGMIIRGIYELTGDTYKVCLPFMGGKERPKTFTSKAGTGFGVEVLKRVKE